MSSHPEDALFSAHAVLTALRSSIRVLRWGMLALVLVYLFSGITVIKPSDVGLILRFGKVLPEIHQPGLLFALPAPFDSVLTVPNKTVEEIDIDDWAAKPGDVPQATMHPVRDPYTLTGDANIIRARFSARYQVSDPIAYIFTATDRDAVCRAVLSDAACKVLAGMSVDDALTTRRDFMAEQIRMTAQQEIDRLGLGVRLIAFEIREIGPPPQVLPAFQDVVSARVEAKTLVEPANAYRASAIPEADSQAYEIAQKAETYAQQTKAQAEGAANSFIALAKEYRANPALVQSRLYVEMLEDVFPKIHLTSVMPASQTKVRLLISPQKPASEDEPSAEPDEPGSSSSQSATPDSTPESLPASDGSSDASSAEPALPTDSGTASAPAAQAPNDGNSN